MMYAWTVLPFVNLTRATLRLAELGFFGFAMKIWLMTPLRCGLVSRSGALDRFFFFCTFLVRMRWFSVMREGGEAWKARKL